ncbi:MAG: hypothetical protein KAT90_05920, partial [Gammaproteobacteria bacterium]|nr:hypothetical protein [Gammaproteobacteria bacterium]
EQAGYWPWLSLLLATGWLITLVALFRKKPKTNTDKVKTDLSSLRSLEKAVQLHATKNDANQTKDALLKWAKANWPDQAIYNLVDISKNVSDELVTEINALNAALYGSDVAQWQGETLNHAFKNTQQQKSKKGQNESRPLEPLYKA